MWLNQNLLAIYNQDNTIFDNLDTPTIFPADSDHNIPSWTFSKTSLINSILLNYGEMSCIFGDPNQLKEAIGIWSDTNYVIWQNLYKSLFVKYNPATNINLTTTRASERDITDTGSGSVTGSIQRSGTDDNTRTFNDTETETKNLTDLRTDAFSVSTQGTDTKAIEGETGGTENITETRNLAQTKTDDKTDTKSVTAYNQFSFADTEKVVTDDDQSITDTGTIGTVKTTSGSEQSSETDTINRSEAHTGTVTDAHSGTDATAHTGTITDAGTSTDSESSTNSSTSSGRRDDDFSETETKTGLYYFGSLVEAMVSWRDYENLNLYDLIAREFKKQFLITIW